MDKVVWLINMLKSYGNIELLFDTVNKTGMKKMKGYMKQVGHENAQIYFYINNGEQFANNNGIKLLKEEAYYKYTNKKGLQIKTKATMFFSGLFNMVKMVHLKIN